MSYTVFDYLYRDASNYKVHGEAWIKGALSVKQQADVVASLEAEEFFVAEQANLPSLIELLLSDGQGPNDDDHCWHTFVGFRIEDAMPANSGFPLDGEAFVAAFTGNCNRWDIARSKLHTII